PPSHTSNDRAVAMRFSPGSNRTITSPRLTKSHRHPCFGLIFKLTNLLSANPRRLQFRRQNVNQKQRNQVSATRHHKRNHVTSRPLQRVPHHFSNQHAPDVSGHPRDPSHRAHRPRRKHVRSQR